MSNEEFAQINQKLDYLLAQFEAQREQQQAMKELMDDAIPIANHVIKLSIDELAEIGNDFQLGDLLFLLKRVLRDTRLLVKLLDQVEAMAELADEGQKIGKRIFHQVTMELDRLEREGYFQFARAGLKVADRLVHDFEPAEVEAMGERLAQALKAEPPENVSLFALLRALFDPKVRRGLYRTLNLLKAIGG
jgi:uncharacterized protein YjgD (DUF1641 family)